MTKSALVTGGTSGLGLALTEWLLSNGWKVTALGRRSMMTHESNQVFHNVDFGRLEAVRRFVDGMRDEYDLLVLNAGIGTVAPGNGKRVESVDGVELRFQVNYLAHYLLIRLLRYNDRVTRQCKTLGVISETCLMPDLGDINLLQRYESSIAYGSSKGALAMLCVDINEGLHSKLGAGSALVCDPGSFIPTGMDRPGRPRLTSLDTAVGRLIAAIDQLHAGSISPSAFSFLPPSLLASGMREALRSASDRLLATAAAPSPPPTRAG